MFPMPALALEHTRVIAQRLQVLDNQFPEVWMSGINEAVVLIRRQSGRNKQQAMLASLSKVVANTGEFRRRCWIAPVGRELRNLDSLRLDLAGHLRDGQHQVLRRIIFIKVNKVFKQRQRLVLRGIAQADSGTRPSSAV